MCVSDSEGGDGEGCGRCLTGAKWDALRQELGAEHVTGRRSTVPTVIYQNWESSTLLSSVFRILLQEMLGYDRVRTAVVDSSYYVTEYAALDQCGGITPEAWFTAPINMSLLAKLPEPGMAISDHLGAVGEEGMYVPAYMPFRAASAESLRMHPELLATLPPDGTVGPDELDGFFPEGDPWGCSNETTNWDVSTCNTGRWYPPQCGDTFPSSSCWEAYLPFPEWSEGWFEAALQNSGLNISVVYPGYEGHLQLIKDAFAQQRPFMFYWWSPTTLLAQNPSRRVAFKDYTKACSEAYHEDPALSGVDCNPASTSIRKVMPGKLAITDPDIHFLWGHFTFNSNMLMELMRLLSTAGGPHNSTHDAACAWLKSDGADAVWKGWLTITDRCVGHDPPRVWDEDAQACVKVHVEEASSRQQLVVIAGIIVVAGLVLLGILLTSIWCKRSAASSPCLCSNMRAAPGHGQMVTLAITDIQGSTSLWDKYPQQLGKAIALHHRCLRACLAECDGYEVATEGDSFKCAFRTPEDAICWATLTQLELLCAPWPEEVEDGGEGALFSPDAWADSSKLPTPSNALDPLIEVLDSADAADVGAPSTLGNHLSEGDVRQPLFSVRNASASRFSRQSVSKSPHSAVWHESSPDPLPVFRGLRVRCGIHTGVADVVGRHEITKRVTYGGQVAALAKAVSNTPSGGQIVTTGETLAEIRSMHNLQKRVSQICKGWASGLPGHRESEPAAMSVIHMGSHLLTDRPLADSLLSMGQLVSASQHAGGEPPMQRSTINSNVLAADNDTQCFLAPRTPPNETVLAVTCLRNQSAHDLLCDKLRQQLAMGAATAVPDSPEKVQMDKLTDEYLEVLSRKMHMSQELLCVVPWPLKARQWCFPPLASIERVTPGLREAPGHLGVTIVFTFIDHWSKLKDWGAADPQHQAVLDNARSMLNIVVRSALLPMHGYEVEGEDGCFVAAFHAAEAAVEFGVLLQSSLRETLWPPALLETPWCRPLLGGRDGATVLLSGPRVKVGMCTGDAVRVQPSLRTGRMEYFGPLMNHAARAAAAAAGGQVILPQATRDAIDMQHLHAFIAISSCGQHMLKGIQTPVDLHQARGQRLAQHTFPQLKTKGKRRTSEDAEDVSGRSCRPSLGLPLSSSARGVRGRDDASRLSLSRSSSASAGDSTHNLHHPAVSPSMLGGLAHDAAGASAPEARRTLFAGDPEAERGTSLPWGDDAAV